MPVYKKILIACIVMLALLTLGNYASSKGWMFSDDSSYEEVYHTQEHINHQAGPTTALGELMIEQQFVVTEGGMLRIEAGDADISVQPHQNNEVYVEIYLDGDNMDRARTYFEEQNFALEQDGDVILVRSRPDRRGVGMRNNGGASIRIEVAAPQRFNLDVQSSDGDISTGDMEGQIGLKTSDGDISGGSYTGDALSFITSDGDIDLANLDSRSITIRTSDGDIRVGQSLSENMDVRTSDGDIVAGSLDGEVSVRTSDGDIAIQNLTGSRTQVHTSDGEIQIQEANVLHLESTTSDGSIQIGRFSGDLFARSSSGDLSLDLVDGENIILRSSDGDIRIDLLDDLGFELDLEAEDLRISSSLDFSGKLEEDRAEGTLFGGGGRLQARTSDGMIEIK